MKLSHFAVDHVGSPRRHRARTCVLVLLEATTFLLARDVRGAEVGG